MTVEFRKAKSMCEEDAFGDPLCNYPRCACGMHEPVIVLQADESWIDMVQHE